MLTVTRYVAILLVLVLPVQLAARRKKPNGTYEATAYAVHGETASGVHTHKRCVAADPDVLPLNSRIRISDAGRYSGVYLVHDTGSKIQGRKLDIFIPNEAEAKEFGKKTVRVRVIQMAQVRK